MEFHEEQRATALPVQQVLGCTEPTTAPILHSSLELHNPCRAPPCAQGKPGDAAGTGASPVQGEAQTAPEEIPPAHVGRDQRHKQLLVSFFPSTCFQGFYLSSADGKAGWERAQPVTSSQQMLLRHRIPRCPGGICAKGPMDNSCLTAGRAPDQAAVGSSTAQPTAACQPCHRATLHPGSIRSWAVPGPRALGMIQQQEVLDNRLSPQQSYSSCFHKPQEQL